MPEPKSHYIHGHLLSGPNLYLHQGKRRCRECRRRVKRANYHRNKAVRSAINRAWRLANLERHRETARRWHRENRERSNLNHLLRWHRKRATGTITRAEWRMALQAHGSACLACGATSDIQMDHVVPISKGGTNTADNVQPLCGFCNDSKGTQIIDYRTWRQTYTEVA